MSKKLIDYIYKFFSEPFKWFEEESDKHIKNYKQFILTLIILMIFILSLIVIIGVITIFFNKGNKKLDEILAILNRQNSQLVTDRQEIVENTKNINRNALDILRLK